MARKSLSDRLVVLIIIAVLAGVAFYYHMDARQSYISTASSQKSEQASRVFNEGKTYYVEKGAYFIKDKNDVVPFERALKNNDKATVESMLSSEKVFVDKERTPVHVSNAHLVEGYSFTYLENGDYIGKQAFVVTKAILDE